jgi:hypothetical protein
MMRGLTSKRRAVARLAVVFLALAVLGGMGAVAGQAAAPFTISIDKPVPFDGLTASLSGVADSPSNTVHHIDVDWGDGNTEEIALDGSGPWTWGPVEHTYADDATYTIVVTLIHAQETGNDKSEATDSTEVTPPCVVDCPTDGNVDGNVDGSTDGQTDGQTDGNVDGSTDGSADGSTDTPPADDTQVLGTTTKKKPLAHTASETTAAAWIAAVMILAGATIRFCAVAPQGDAIRAFEADTDELVGKSLDLVTRSVRTRR